MAEGSWTDDILLKVCFIAILATILTIYPLSAPQHRGVFRLPRLQHLHHRRPA